MGPFLFVFLVDLRAFGVLGHNHRRWFDGREGKVIADDQPARNDGGDEGETLRVKKLILREHHPGQENLKAKVEHQENSTEYGAHIE